MKDQCSLAKSCLAFGAEQTLITCWSAALPPTLVLMAIPQWVEWHWSAGRQAGRTNTLSHWHGSVLSDLLYIITWLLTRQRGGEGQCFNSHLVRVHCVLCKHIYPGMCGVWTCLNLLHWQYAVLVVKCINTSQQHSDITQVHQCLINQQITSCTARVYTLGLILSYASWRRPLDLCRKVAPATDTTEKIYLLTWTANISVGKCVAQQPGSAIGDPF